MGGSLSGAPTGVVCTAVCPASGAAARDLDSVVAKSAVGPARANVRVPAATGGASVSDSGGVRPLLVGFAAFLAGFFTGAAVVPLAVWKSASRSAKPCVHLLEGDSSVVKLRAHELDQRRVPIDVHDAVYL